MSIVRSIARHLFGKSWEVIDLKIAFHKEANLYGTHGTLIASHRDLKLSNEQVRFVFVGLSEPPAMTPRVIEYIWEEARAKGFIPTSVASYGEILETHTNLDPRALISADRRVAEDANWGRLSANNQPAVSHVATASMPGIHLNYPPISKHDEEKNTAAQS